MAFEVEDPESGPQQNGRAQCSARVKNDPVCRRPAVCNVSNGRHALPRLPTPAEIAEQHVGAAAGALFRHASHAPARALTMILTPFGGLMKSRRKRRFFTA